MHFTRYLISDTAMPYRGGHWGLLETAKPPKKKKTTETAILERHNQNRKIADFSYANTEKPISKVANPQNRNSQGRPPYIKPAGFLKRWLLKICLFSPKRR